MFKHNPLSFHQRAMPAAMATECAREQGKFWQLHDAIFENQRALEDADLEKYAQGVGLNMGPWKDCYKANKHQARIMNDQALSMKLGARGTPAFYINGKFLSGAQPFPAFDSIVSAELEKAKGSGISRSEYYQKVVVEKGDKAM